MKGFYPLENKLFGEGAFFIAGIDEAGRGPMAGPVVCAAVVLKRNTVLKGLRDSKLLTARKRESLFVEIIKKCVDFSITIVPHDVIDLLNILNAVRFANKQCIRRLSVKPDYVLVDGNDKQLFSNKSINIIDGDKYIKSVAAASVLAKVFRDSIMREYAKIYIQYGFEKHMGYGTRLHKTNILKYGRTEIHRKTFEFKN